MCSSDLHEDDLAAAGLGEPGGAELEDTTASLFPVFVFVVVVVPVLISIGFGHHFNHYRHLPASSVQN